MFGLINMTRIQRLVLGVIVLLIVDIIWVVSSEVTEHIFTDFKKPFFTTYVKISMFVLYLSGFLFRKTWRQQCNKNAVISNPMDDSSVESDNLLGEAMYVPLKFDEKLSTDSESDDAATVARFPRSRSVRFSNLMEVRQLSDVYAEEAVLSRMSYPAYLRADEARMRVAGKLSVRQILKTAAIFSLVFFIGNLAYQIALKDTEAAIVNVLSSTSGLFTLVLASVFPSSNSDRFTLSKFLAVVVSMGGVVVVTLADKPFESHVPKGAISAIVGALMYALYLVLLRRRVDNEQKLNLPMFLGFVGLIVLLSSWPVFFVLHYSHWETFQMPSHEQWLYIIINGLIGTVVSDLLWLWGCFLTSSLVATLSLSLTIPMTMVADSLVKNVHYNWMFYVGSLPVFLSFFLVSVLTHYESWDPALSVLKKLLQCICRWRIVPRFNVDMDREQRESLIGINNSDEPLST